MLCFDPTRGIDIGTKQQIYQLLRDLAAAGAAVLLYTSELKEIQLACDRAIVIFGGRVVAEIAAADADEPTLLRAAYDLKPDEAMPEEVAAVAGCGRGAGVEPAVTGGRASGGRPGARAAVGASLAALRRLPPQHLDAGPDRRSLIGFFVITKLIQPNYGAARHPGARDRDPADRARRGRPGDRRDLGRHRPVGRLDDGVSRASSRRS